MTTKERDYVKAIFSFQSQSPSDLNLQVGDVVLITEVIDSQWLKGQKVGQTAEGIFPLSFVEPLPLPSCRTGQKIFLVLQNFGAEQPGDLELTKGEVILGIEKVDDDWWKGKNGPLKGIFPVIFVAELEHNDGPRSRSASARSNSLKSRTNSLIDQGSSTKLQETVFARALVDVKPQLDGELAFQMGDMIEITEFIDEDWMFGKCHNKEGLVSSVCVELLDDGDSGVESNINSSFESKVQDRVQDLIRPGKRNSQNRPRTSTDGSYTSENTRSHDAEVTPYGQVLFPFVAQLPDELSLEEGQIVNLIQHIDSDWTQGEIDGRKGMFPSNFVEIIVDCPYALPCDAAVDKNGQHKMNGVELENERNKSRDSAGALDTLEAKNKTSNDLNGANLQEELADLQKETDAQLSAVSANVAEAIVVSGDHEIGLVCHSFQASIAGDISVMEGETVEVIKKVDDNWVQVQSESGDKGLVPINHIDIIGSWPREEDGSSSKEVAPEKSKDNVDNGRSESVLNSKTAGQSLDTSAESAEVSTMTSIPAPFESEKNSLLFSNSHLSERSLFTQLGVLASQGSQSSAQENSPTTVSKPSSKPTAKHKPPLAPKPVITPKPFVTKAAHFYTAKPYSSNASRRSHVVSPTEKKMQILESLDNLIEGELDKAKSRSSSENSSSSIERKDALQEPEISHTKCATLPSKLDDNRFKLSECVSKRVSSVDVSSDSKDSFKDLSVENKKEDLAAFAPVVSKSDSSPMTADARSRRALLTVSHSLQDDSDQPRSQSSLQNKRASITVMDGNIQSQCPKSYEAYAEAKPNSQAAVPANNKDSSFINNAFEMDVAEGNLIGNVNNAKTVSTASRKPARAPPPRPVSAIFPSSSISQSLAGTTTRKCKSPPPRPVGPRLTNPPSKDPLQSVTNLPSKDPLQTAKTDDSHSKPKLVPQRPAPKAPGSGKGGPRNQTNSGIEDKRAPISEAPSQSRKQIVPARKAPPRPVTMSKSGSHVPHKTADLIQFSPEKPAEEDDEPQKETVNDLKTRLFENSADIKNIEQNRVELENSLASKDNSQARQGELRDNLHFVDSSLQGLREEQKKLKENLICLSGNEERNERSRLLAAQRAEEEKRRKEEEIQHEVEQRVKRREQRNKVISEIMETEKNYLFSLHLCLETFLDVEKPAPPGLDVDFLLGNTEEIADVSQKMLLNLESNVTGKPFEEQCIGVCFTATAEDMKNTYAPYCRNHDEVIKALESFGENEEISEFLNHKVEKIKEQMNLFDVSSLLIKPVQRILKYPLLLNELLQNTEDNHQDKQEIIAAIKAMTDVAKAINEYKRRKDLVYKYKRSSDERFSDKIAKLNLHSIKKKSTRIRGRLSTNLGLSLQLKDEGFEKEEAKFRSIEKAVRTFLSSTTKYLEQSQEAMRYQENLVDGIVEFYRENECVEIQKFHQVNTKLLDLYVKMRSTIEDTVVVPLNTLMKFFNAPSQVIGKRFDKLLDYNHQLGKGGEHEKELKATKNDYEAMNAQLMDELPKFYNITFNLLQHCMSAFVQARRDFMDQSLKESCALLELPSMISKDHMMEIFKIRHTTAFDHMSMLNFIPRGFNPKVDTVKADKARQRGKSAISDAASAPNLPQALPGGQSDSQRTYLYQTYPPDKLYIVTTTHNANDLMDISLTEGSIVGVVKELDPMGNKDRWFVDDGVTKGFAPSNVLTKTTSLPIANSSTFDDDVLSFHSYDSTSTTDPGLANRGDDKISFTSLTNSSYESVPLQTMDSSPVNHQPPEEGHQYYYALYDFQARHSNEASLMAGTPVTVLAFQDSDGNSEWWLVDSEGSQGYAPANYMAPMPYS